MQLRRDRTVHEACSSNAGNTGEDDEAEDTRPTKRRRRSFLVTEETKLEERCVEARKGYTREDGSRPNGYLRQIVLAEFPQCEHDDIAFRRELSRIKRCLKRADATSANVKKSRTMTVRRLRYKDKTTLRRRGNPGKEDYAPELHQELFHWVVDTIQNVKGRINSDVLALQVTKLSQDLRRYYMNEVKAGRMDTYNMPKLPKLERQEALSSWIFRFRKKHHLAWNAVNLRLKCSRKKTLVRVRIFFRNLYIVRWLHFYLHGEREVLRFEDSDEKPLWYTSADQEKTLNFVGTKRKACVKENVPHTRKRFTFKSRCQYPARLNDGKHGAILIKGSENLQANQLQHDLLVPDGFLLQFAPRASYRLNQNLDYYRWIVPQCDGPPNQTVYLTDWNAPNVNLAG